MIYTCGSFVSIKICNIYGQHPTLQEFLSTFWRRGSAAAIYPACRAARRLLALMRSADQRPIRTASSSARCCKRVWPIPVRPVVPSRCQSPSQSEGEPGYAAVGVITSARPTALFHSPLFSDPNLFVRSSGPPLRPDLSFPGAPRAATARLARQGHRRRRLGLAGASTVLFCRWSGHPMRLACPWPPYAAAGSATASGLQ